MSRLAVLGTGHWGRNLVRNFNALGVLAAVGDPDPDRLATARRDYPGVRCEADVSTLIADPEIDAVAVAAPAALHHGLARAALEAGKDVFVEKPLALSVAHGEELVRLAAERGRMLMVGHVLRYHPAVRRLVELVGEGALGQVRYLYSNRLNIGRIRTEENILWSFAPHDISVMLALLGEEPVRLSCRGSDYLSAGVPDVTLSTFAFPSGVTAHIFVSWLHPFKEQRLVVVGSEKMAVFEDTAEHKLLLYPHRVEWRERVPTAVKAEAEVVELADEEPLANECRHFLESIETRRPPLTDGREGLSVLRILARCQESLEAGRSLPTASAPERSFFAHQTAVVADSATVGAGTKIWHFSHVMAGARIGRDCSFGQNCHVAPEVVVGDGVKVQNNVSIYTGTTIEDHVFLGPSCVLTNVTNPRAEVSRQSLYETTRLRRGCSIGANATVVCGVEVGRYAFVGAGAVVTEDVADYALMLGVPARRSGWMSRHGLPLREADGDGVYTCPESGLRYREEEPGILRCLDLGEDEPLPEEMRTGHRSYDEVLGREE
ncbi:MAG TPA: Gfo/Idh/MocA family oxidoreductase [Thermoanaerobaculia bacterium]|nr:Gfo/Idh/MocA family oxidoreductase [Thermoanaerobaculia bacterium]